MQDKIVIKKGANNYVIFYKFSDIPVQDFVVYEVLYENGIKGVKQLNYSDCICFTYKCCKVIVYYKKAKAVILASSKLDENIIMDLVNEIKEILHKIAEKMKVYANIAGDIAD